MLMYVVAFHQGGQSRIFDKLQIGSGVKIRWHFKREAKRCILSCKLALCFGSSVKVSICVMEFHQKGQKCIFIF